MIRENKLFKYAACFLFTTAIFIVTRILSSASILVPPNSFIISSPVW